ncbi:retrovirus-related pol polyprotein from transposon TNT 1-94 [Tanacetum coccineum]
MHKNFMAVGSKDRPPMLVMGRYAQWRSCFLRYIDTRPNGDALRKCILQGPYTPSTVTIPAIHVIDDTLAVLERTAVETILNMSPENKAHYELEKEAIHLLLTGIGDEIYSAVNACKTAQEMWIAIKRLQQVNVQFLQQLQPEWSRFMTIDKQQYDLDTVSYHKLFDVLKQYQKEVNEIHTERIAKNANPLALVAAASPYPDAYYQAPKSYTPYAPTSKQLSSTRSNASTKFKGKEIAKPITPPSESASEEDSDPEQAQRDKDMQKNLALIAKYLKKIYKPTNKNLRTSSNSRNKNVDTSPWYKNDNQTGKFRNQKTVTITGARETVGSQVVQQTRIQCFNCKEFDHFAKECRKPKRVKDSTYHKEKMLLCKQAEKGVPLQAKQSNWLADMDEEIDEQELEAHYSFIAKIQERKHSEQPESISNTCVVEKVDSYVIPDSPDMCDNDIQTNQNAKDKRVALANLIANLKLNVDENKKIQKKLKKANTSLAHELNKCKSILAKTSRTLGESNSIWDSCLIALQNK